MALYVVQYDFQVHIIFRKYMNKRIKLIKLPKLTCALGARFDGANFSFAYQATISNCLSKNV